MARCRTAAAAHLALTFHDRVRRRNCAVDSIGWYIKVGDRAHGTGSEHAKAYTMTGQRPGVEGLTREPSTSYVKHHDIGFHCGRVQVDAGQGSQFHGQPASALMVLRQPVNVMPKGVYAG